MRFSGTIFAVSLLFLSLLCIAWFMNPAGDGGVPGVADLQAADRPAEQLEQVLSGDFKRAPKKNPDMGQGRLRGTVTDADGSPAAGAKIQVTPADRGANIREERPPITHYWETASDSRGAFAFRNLPGGDFAVSASLSGRQAVAMARVADPGPFEETQLALAERVSRRGTVRDGDGNPVAGARIIPIAAPGWPGDAYGYRHLSVSTDEKGGFVHPLLPPGSWDVLAVARGAAPARATLAEGEATPIQLGAGAELQGRVLREADQRPLSNIRILISALDEAGEYYVARTNGQGFFSVEGLRPATYRVRADDIRFIAESTVTLDESAEGAPLTVTLPARDGASIRGRVLKSAAEYGIPGIRVEAFAESETVPAAAAETDQAGYYHLRGLDGGSYRLSAPGTDQLAIAPEGDATVTVAPGRQESGPVFRVATGETFRGMVVDSQGAAVAEANVFLRRGGYPGGLRGVVTGSGGEFVLSGIHEDDQVTIWAEVAGQRSEEFGPMIAGAGGLEGIRLRMIPAAERAEEESEAAQQTPPRSDITSTRSS